MRLDYVNSFSEATVNVLAEMLKEKVGRGRPTLETGVIPKNGFIIVFALTGDVTGRVVFDMTEETAVNIAGFMNASKFASIEPLVMDSIAELMNLIVGRSISVLNDMGFKFYLAPPAIFTGKDIALTIPGIETLVLPVKTSFGDVTVSVALKATL